MAQDFLGKPPARSTVDELDKQGIPFRVNRLWNAFFERVFDICFALSQSGTTAQRPTVRLWNGRFYWDTTLGQPIWWDSVAEEWVDATGTAV